MGIAFRLGTEMTVATLIGALMGYAVDYYFETKPWGVAIGVLLGGAAGMLNVYRAAQEITAPENEKNDKNPKDKDNSI